MLSRSTDWEPSTTGPGPKSSHLCHAYSVAWAQLGLGGFAGTGAQRQGLLCLITTVEIQGYGPGTPFVGPRVLDHGPQVLVL